MLHTSADARDVYKCPDRLRLPLIFYMGHTATLYVNKLLLAGLITVSPHSPVIEYTKGEGLDELMDVGGCEDIDIHTPGLLCLHVRIVNNESVTKLTH